MNTPYVHPTLSYDEDDQRLFIHSYKIQDLAQLLPAYALKCLKTEGNHKNFDAIAQLHSLEELDVRACKASDFSFLRGMKIKSLRLCHTRVDSIEAFTQMPDLERLSLWANPRLKDLRGLESCATITHLWFYSCHKIPYPDFAAMKGLVKVTLECCSGVSKQSLDSIRDRVKIYERKVTYSDV